MIHCDADHVRAQMGCCRGFARTSCEPCDGGRRDSGRRHLHSSDRLRRPGPNTVTEVQQIAPGGQYTIPTAGVITSWSVQSGPIPSALAKLKLMRPAGGDNFTVVAESTPGMPAANTTTSFATRIPVSGGELLARRSVPTTAPGADCGNRFGQGAAYSWGAFIGDPGVGSTDAYPARPGVSSTSR